jgi:general secretion pathway protein A
VAAASRHELVSTLHEFLISLLPIGGSGVLIIDEAQHLSPQVLEEIRVLSNLETNQTKLMQIVLVGQLNLLELLRQPDQRRLDQRISLRVVLRPLTRTDVESYVAHRLTVAKGTSPAVFDAEALDTVHEASGGVPRLINLVCDRTLMLGAALGERTLTADVVREAARTLGLLLSASAQARWWNRLPRWAPIVVTLLLLLATAFWIIRVWP